jgi:hypothetical protein
MARKDKKGDTAAQDTAAQDFEWLEILETRVREASRRLRELKKENARLAARVEKLESATDPDEAAGAWRQERDEIRGRVEHLAETLQSLLDEE